MTFLFHPGNPRTIRIEEPFAVKSHVVGFPVDKPLPVPLGPLQGLFPVPLRRGYPVAGVLFKVDFDVAVITSGSRPYTVLVFRPSLAVIV
jgi:hypothetical protein